MSIKTKTNDGIYIISPSSAIGSPQALSRAQQRLEELGFEPSVDPDACAVYERFAGTDAQRLSAFERALQQPAPFVLASRGGYGMSRLLPFINWQDRKSTRLNSSHVAISYAVFCLKKKKNRQRKGGKVLEKESSKQVKDEH